MTSRAHPWMKFYPADWRAEPSLRAVSLAARGLWIEMLCLMHEAEPRGHLLLNGRPVTDSQLSALAGVPLDQTQGLLVELEGAGTFSRTRAGVIYSRRMRSDSASSEKQRANVEKRWSKSRSLATAQDVETTRQNDSRITNCDTEAIPKKPETRNQNKPPNPQGGDPPGFQVWWGLYPKKTAKGAARTAYRGALKKIGADQLLDRLSAHRFADDPRFIPNPATWLNGERWADEAAEPVAAMLPLEPADPWPRRLLGWRTAAYWNSDWGPKPGRDGYLGPPLDVKERAA